MSAAQSGGSGADGRLRAGNGVESKRFMNFAKDIYQKNWQTPTNIINYVKNNKNKIGEIGAFDIYE